MSHQEFVNFDLLNKSTLPLKNLLSQMLKNSWLMHFDANTNWLQEHNISREKLQLSDNFYYGANGIVLSIHL